MSEANLVIDRSDGFRLALRMSGVPDFDMLRDDEARSIGELVRLVGPTLVAGMTDEVLGEVCRRVARIAERLSSRIVVEFEAGPVGAENGGPT